MRSVSCVVTVVIISVVIGFAYYKFDELTRPLPLPELDIQKYWGAGDGSKHKVDQTIKSFKIQATPESILDLRKQLNRTSKLTEPLEGTHFEYGMNSKVLERIITYWRDEYLTKWTEHEKYLNKFPQFTTEIQGLRIHFIHIKSSVEQSKSKKVIPLLLLHGWPGSVREFYDLLPILTEPSETHEYIFEVVAPSLVGYGWSQPAAKPGFHAAHMAIVMRNLMLRLGYKKFLVQGGDWGSIIGSNLATIFPDNVIGYHSNMCILNTPLSRLKYVIANYFPEKFLPSRFFYDHHFPLSEKFMFMLKESGYFHIQATKPDTIGTALIQSPIGLAAWILEKFQTATGPGLNENKDAMSIAYGYDAVLDNLMIYYLTNSATTAARFYSENASKQFSALQMDRVPTPVPMGCIHFRNDLPGSFEWQLYDKYPNLLHNSYYHQGGHFAAMETPVMLYMDFLEFVQKIQL